MFQMEMVYFKIDNFNRKIILVNFPPNNFKISVYLLIILFFSLLRWSDIIEGTWEIDSVKKKI